MKVYIKKGQDEKKGLFGGHKGMKFSLSCRIELTSSESALIEKYRVWEYSVLSFKDKRGNNIVWNIKDLAKVGNSIVCDGVQELLQQENEIKVACKSLKTLLDVMASFGGEEVIEY